MNWDEFQDKLGEVAEEMLDQATVFKPQQLGLDRRACYKIWRGDDFLAIDKKDKGSMAYYGGFEYVDAENVLEAGPYVLYSTESPRVLGHWEQAEEADEPLCPNCNGSGEGMHEGATCSRCHGRGTLPEGEGDE